MFCHKCGKQFMSNELFWRRCIVQFLEKYYGISMNLRTLKRRLCEFGLRLRRNEVHSEHEVREIINNGNRTEWSPIRSVIVRVINKIGRPQSGGFSQWVDLIWLAALTVRLKVSDYGQLSDYNFTEWSVKCKAADATITFEEIVMVMIKRETEGPSSLFSKN